MAWSWGLRPDTVEHANALQLTNAEMILLATFDYQQALHGGRTVYEVAGTGKNKYDLDPMRHEAYQSLCRFGYIVAAEPREVRSAAVVDILSPSGEGRLSSIKARLYKCCSYAIRLPCVCSESTFCPNPDHHGGCHGTHD